MAEVLFYRLSQTPLERTLPNLLEKSLERGWRVFVRSGSKERLEKLDQHLWTYRSDSFLPHGLNDAENQPIFLGEQPGNPNGASALMLVFGARVNTEEAGTFERTCVLFDGNDESAAQTARDDWKSVVTASLKAVYWAQEGGRWVQKSESASA